jgi:hypothetical protein
MFGAGSNSLHGYEPQMFMIKVQLVDGRNGTPLSNRRLLGFTGKSAAVVNSHVEHIEVMTDKEGVGILSMLSDQSKRIQVFADCCTLCYADPNHNSFDVSQILAEGVSTPNNCGSLVREASRGHLIVFARPASLVERMKR